MHMSRRQSASPWAVTYKGSKAYRNAHSCLRTISKRNPPTGGCVQRARLPHALLNWCDITQRGRRPGDRVKGPKPSRTDKTGHGLSLGRAGLACHRTNLAFKIQGVLGALWGHGTLFPIVLCSLYCVPASFVLLLMPIALYVWCCLVLLNSV